MAALSWTGERYLPWERDPVTAYEHWHRYAYAAQFVSGKNVLDLASGEGYGSATLARTAQRVIALDINEDAVNHARLKYRSNNLQFIVGSIMELPLFKIGFDIIVCFEAIEHISGPEQLLNEVKRVLLPSGLFLVSTPNKPEYKKSEISNPFHVGELDFEEFQAMLVKHFRRTQFLGQRVYCNSSLWTIADRTSSMVSEYLLDRDNNAFTLAGDDKRVPLYFVGIASDAEDLPGVTGAVLVDGSNSLLKEAARIQDETSANVQSLKDALAWRERQLLQTQETLQVQEQALVWKEDQLREARTALSWEEEQLKESQAALSREEGQLKEAQIALSWEENRLKEAQTAIAWKEDQLKEAQTALAWKEDQLKEAQTALAWKEEQLRKADATIHSHEQALAWKDEQLKESQIALSWEEEQLRKADATIRSHEQALEWKDKQLKETQTALSWEVEQLRKADATIHSHEQALAWRESQMNELTGKINILRSECERSAAELSAIKSSRSWKFIQKIWKIRKRLFPSGSRRTTFYDRGTGS
jgi:ubiquinone/menaquinone biosynthesis C-methylase UbiE